MDTFGPAVLSSIERLSALLRFKWTSIIGKRPQSAPFREFFLLFGVSVYIGGSTVYQLLCSLA